MADRMLFISWKEPARGREARALEIFSEALAILGGRQQDGRIESFDVGLFDPNGALGGYILVKGSQEQISELQASEDFRRNTTESAVAVDGIAHHGGVTGEGVGENLGRYQEVIGQYA